MGLSLILPTLNERENVEALVPELLAELADIGEILVVDDGSTDGTREAVARLAEQDVRVRLISRRGPPCLTDAIQEGVLAARGELVGWMDADLVNLPADLARLVDAVRAGADVAVGSRFVAGGRIKGQERDGLAGRLLAMKNLRTTEDPWLGVLLSWLLNEMVLPAIVGLGVRDYTSGIVVGRSEVLRGVRLRGDHGEYFIPLWAELHARGRSVVEVSYRVRPRRFGVSKTGNNLGDYIRRGRRYIAAGFDARRILAGGRDDARGRGADPGGSLGGEIPARSASSRAKRTSR
jgi:dolichol-phosphate mannosyltransferase